MFDFDLMWMNLLSGFTFEGVYEQETEVIINGEKQKEKGKLYEVCFHKKNTRVTLYIDDNEVIDIDFSFYPFGDEEEGD